jgi:hypothetical protein
MEPDVTTGLSCTSPDEGSQYVQPGKTPVSNSKLFHRAEERSRDLLSSDGGRLQHATGGEVGVVQAGSGREVGSRQGSGLEGSGSRSGSRSQSQRRARRSRRQDG